MNNSFIKSPIDTQVKKNLKERYIEEETSVIRVIEAIQKLKESREWSTLKTEIFDSLTENLKKDLFSEAQKPDTNPMRLNRLAGELSWAEKFSDLQKLEDRYKVELQRIRVRIQHGTE